MKTNDSRANVSVFVCTPQKVLPLLLLISTCIRYPVRGRLAKLYNLSTSIIGREAITAYPVEWHILIYWAHIREFPKDGKYRPSKYRKYRTTRNRWVLMPFCKQQERTFHYLFWKSTHRIKLISGNFNIGTPSPPNTSSSLIRTLFLRTVLYVCSEDTKLHSIYTPIIRDSSVMRIVGLSLWSAI